MGTISELSVSDFSTHHKAKIELGPITVITGPSDSGKSALVTALLWCVTNTPRGTSFIRHGADTASVRVTVNGATVTRTRGKTVNAYHVVGESAGEREFVAMGAEVPDAVRAMLNIGPNNIQRQMDGPFWLSLTPGALAGEIQAVVDLRAAGRVVAAARSSVASAKQQENTAAGILANHKARLESLQHVPDMVARWDAVRAAHDARNATVDSVAAISKWVREADARRETGRQHGDTLRALEVVRDKLAALTALQRETAEISRTIAAADAARAKARATIPDIEHLKTADAARREAAASIATIRNIIDHAEREAERIRKYDEAIQRKTDEANEAKRAAPTCPTCGKPL